MIDSGYVYTAAAGETWDAIALSLYDDEAKAADLLAANPPLSRISVFSGGEVLTLPVVEVVDAENEEEAELPAKAPWKE